MALNDGFDFPCYVSSDCHLICKDESGSFLLPGTALSGEACQQYRDYLATLNEGNGNRDGSAKTRGGKFGLLNIDLPDLFGLSHLFDGLLQKIADALGIDVTELKELAKTLLIIGGIVLIWVIFKTIF